MTGVHCSNASSDMSCKMADLDKAAGKGWEDGNGEESRGKTERERENDENDSMDQKVVNKDQMQKMH